VGSPTVWDIVRGRGLDADVVAYGFPENVLSGGNEPTERLFRGHVQREFRHKSHRAFEYDALELSFACPAGLSGGPVFDRRSPLHVVGIATENFESTTTLETIEQRTRSGETEKTRYQRILSYGIAVNGACLAEWSAEHLPALDRLAWQARAGRPPVGP
jgi:hypothetical protein